MDLDRECWHFSKRIIEASLKLITRSCIIGPFTQVFTCRYQRQSREAVLIENFLQGVFQLVHPLMLFGYRLTVIGLVFPGDNDPNGLRRPIKTRAKCLRVPEEDLPAILHIG